MRGTEQVCNLSKESLNQLSAKELVEIVIGQQEIIEKLREEIEKLRQSRDLDSKSSSKPPSTDLLRKSEKEGEKAQQKKKRKPGGQPGHKGKTRKGFGRIDKEEVLNPASL